MFSDGEDVPVPDILQPPAGDAANLSLYSPKPAYDQLEVYSAGGSGNRLSLSTRSGGSDDSPKQRRRGLFSLHQAELLQAVNCSTAAAVALSTAEAPASGNTTTPVTTSATSLPVVAPELFPPSVAATAAAAALSVAMTRRALVHAGPKANNDTADVIRPAVAFLNARLSSVTSSEDESIDSGGAVEITVPVPQQEGTKGGSSCSSSSQDAVSTTSGEERQPLISVDLPWPELTPTQAFSRLQEAWLPHTTPVSQLSSSELESAFRRVELSVKIDRVTLLKRLDVLRRQRDTAHANYSREMAVVAAHMAALDGDCLKSDVVTELSCLKKSLKVVAVAVEALVSASQQWAAVQQEWGFSRAVEVLQTYTDQTLKLYTQANKQIKQLKSLVPPPNPTSTPTRHRALSLNPPQENRRLSLNPSSRGPGSPRLGRTSLLAGGGPRRASLSHNMKPFKETLASHTKGSGNGGLAALNLARVSSIVEESGSDGDPDPAGARPLSNRAAASDAVVADSRETADSAESMWRDGSSAAEGEEVATDTRTTAAADDLTEEAVARLQMFYQHAVEAPLRHNSRDVASYDCLESGTRHQRQQLLENHEDLDDEKEEDEEDDDDDDDYFLQEHLTNERHHQLLSAARLATSTSIYQTRSQQLVTAVYSWMRGAEQWPWTRQQTTLGARWLVCGVLILFALMLLVAVTLPQPSESGCRQGWTWLTRPCHPYVQLTYLGSSQSPT